MESMKQNEMIVTQKPEIAYAGPAVCFFFSTFCVLFWANMLGFLGEGGGLVIGIVQLGAFPCFVVGSAMLLKKGLSLEGNIFLIFNALFCGAGGFFNFFSGIADFKGIAYDSRVMGILWIYCGIFLFLMLIPTSRTPLANFLAFVFAALSLFLLGLIMVGALPGTLMALPAWLLLISGICALWLAVSALCGFAGVNIPLGPIPVKGK